MSVRFITDYRKYPGCISDDKTRNKSFLRICSLYKSMGVKNWHFPLLLIQPELQGVDPYDESLELETQVKIIRECDENIWYYLREVVRDPSAGFNPEECMFKADRASIAATWLFLCCIDYVRIQPRQTGKSFGTDTITNWLMYFKYRDTTLNIITKDESLRKSHIARLKKLRDSIPNYLLRNTNLDDNNQITMSCKMLSNKLYTHVSQASEKSANNLGRGLTSPYIHIDEAPFINHIEATVVASMGSTNTARDIASRKNFPYNTTYTTTAGNREDKDGKYVFDLTMSGAVWTELFLDAKDKEDLVKLITINSNSRAPIVNLTMSHRQLGLSDEWLYNAIANARAGAGNPNIDRDYFNRWTSSSSRSLLPEAIAKLVRQSESEAIHHDIAKDGYIFYLYEYIDRSESYVLGVDTSNAIGRDDIAVVLVSASSGATIGAGSFNETNLIKFGSWLFEFLYKFSNITLIIENKHNAQAIIDLLIIKFLEKNINPFTRMYSELTQNEKYALQLDMVLKAQGMKLKDLTNDNRRHFGFSTNSEKRDFLFSNVYMNASKEVGSKVRDSKLITQMLSLVDKKGRIDHADGEHDDMVIAWLLAHWFLNYAYKLNVYGINSFKILKYKKDKQNDTENQFKAYIKNERLLRIDQLGESLKNATTKTEMIRIECEIDRLLSKLDGDETYDGLTLDAIVEKIEAQKKLAKNKTSSHATDKKKLLLEKFGR